MPRNDELFQLAVPAKNALSRALQYLGYLLAHQAILGFLGDLGRMTPFSFLLLFIQPEDVFRLNLRFHIKKLYKIN
jgi:hypothetical protein